MMVFIPENLICLSILKELKHSRVLSFSGFTEFFYLGMKSDESREFLENKSGKENIVAIIPLNRKNIDTTSSIVANRIAVVPENINDPVIEDALRLVESNKNSAHLRIRGELTTDTLARLLVINERALHSGLISKDLLLYGKI